MTDVQVEEPTIDELIEAAETTEGKLNVLTPALGKQYDLWKDEEEEKDRRKVLFFDLLTDYIQSNIPLERSTEKVLLKKDEDIDAALATRYPDMRVALDSDGDPLMEENPEDDREWIVIMEPDPRFMKFQWVSREDERVYSRGRSDRGGSFDVLGFVDEFPELAEKCIDQTLSLTVPPSVDVEALDAPAIHSLATIQRTLNEEKAQAMVVADPSLLPIFMKFRVAPKVVVTLPKYRKAKADEL